MTQFREGQEVEVVRLKGQVALRASEDWRKAKIREPRPNGTDWVVTFLDGTMAIFDATDIRAAVSP